MVQGERDTEIGKEIGRGSWGTEVSSQRTSAMMRRESYEERRGGKLMG